MRSRAQASRRDPLTRTQQQSSWKVRRLTRASDPPAPCREAFYACVAALRKRHASFGERRRAPTHDPTSPTRRLRRPRGLEARLRQPHAELSLPTLPDRAYKIFIGVADEIRERRGLAILFTHEQQRHEGRQQICACGQLSPLISRLPEGRLPIWPWFCTQTTKRSAGSPKADAPCRRPR